MQVNYITYVGITETVKKDNGKQVSYKRKHSVVTENVS